MDEKLDTMFFESLTKSTEELFWVTITIGDNTKEIPYMLIPKNEKPPLKLKKMPNIGNAETKEEVRKEMEKDLKGNIFDYLDYNVYIDDLSSISLEMIKRGIQKTKWTTEQKEIVTNGFVSMESHYPNLFGMVSNAIQGDIEERTKLFFGGQETLKSE